MQPAQVPAVAIYAGDYVEFPGYVITDSEAVPLDLSAYTNWRAMWRRTAQSATSVELTVDSSQVAVGRIGIVADSTATRAMGASGVWDVQADDPDGVQTFVYGTTRWREDVTRD